MTFDRPIPVLQTRALRAKLANLTIISAAILLGACANSNAPNAPDALNPSATTAAPNTPQLTAAIAGPQRGDTARARDVYRHPQQTLQFFELAPSQSVLEIAPGGGWYTEILAPYLHDHGTLYEAQYDGVGAAPSSGEQAGRAAFARKLAASPAIYGHVVVGTLRAGQFSGFPANASVDRVLTFRNIHNWIKDGQIDANLRAFYAALKPGGLLGVEEHRAAPGTTLQQTIDTGYVTEAYVIEHAQAAGFVLVGKSEINANPRDTKDYPHGVWSLPPSYEGGDADRARFAAIGESDRMTLRFVKPR
ncbi:class I SAM-dependent methyltransferase [Paraburkholderia sp. BCC1886]|uniref:class I SAM-dependent methyltransferase n=1 Tax=Paraburkholderia sp. BCC1886 TaxID=2562670 RepID=UPI00391F0BF8